MEELYPAGILNFDRTFLSAIFLISQQIISLMKVHPDTIAINGKNFEISISSGEIQKKVDQIARELNRDLGEKEVVFIAVLNGAFMFASDLLKKIDFNCRISFLKLASYQGTESTGRIKQLIGLNEELENKTVVLIEDVIDSGGTLNLIKRQISSFQPLEMKVVTLLFKPHAYKYHFMPDYTGFSIPDDFIVGYGLDYMGYGRNLNSIYTLINS